VFWCVIWQSVEFLSIQNKDKPDFPGLTVVLILQGHVSIPALIAPFVCLFRGNAGIWLSRQPKVIFAEHGKVVAGLLRRSGLLN
jgi:hypothetical protein